MFSFAAKSVNSVCNQGEVLCISDKIYLFQNVWGRAHGYILCGLKYVLYFIVCSITVTPLIIIVFTNNILILCATILTTITIIIQSIFIKYI